MLCLFDLDGTLIDSGRGIYGGIRHALASVEADVPAESVLRDWIGPPLRHSFRGVLEDEVLVDRAIEAYHQRFVAGGWREHEVYAGIPVLIEALHAAGHTLAVVTSKQRLHAEPILAELPFARRFSALYAPQGTNAHSEKAAMIAQALADFAVPAAQTAMIGDRRYDIEGAVANEVRGIGVLWGFGSVEELRQAGAHAIVADPVQLGELLLG